MPYSGAHLLKYIIPDNIRQIFAINEYVRRSAAIVIKLGCSAWAPPPSYTSSTLQGTISVRDSVLFNANVEHANEEILMVCKCGVHNRAVFEQWWAPINRWKNIKRTTFIRKHSRMFFHYLLLKSYNGVSFRLGFTKACEECITSQGTTRLIVPPYFNRKTQF